MTFHSPAHHLFGGLRSFSTDFLWSGLAISSICLFAILSSAGCRQRESVLVVCGSETHDFGRCKQDDVLSHEFVIENAGSVPLEIIGLATSCGCLVADDKFVQDGTIDAGARVALPVQFNVGGAEDITTARVNVLYRPADGQRVHRNGSDSRKISLLLRAEIIPDYRISPREIDFGDVDGLTATKLTQVIKVEPEAISDVNVLSVACSSDAVTARKICRSESDKTQEIEVSVDFENTTSNQNFRASLVLETNSERLPKAIVPIKANYRSPVAFAPSTIEIGSNVNGEVVKTIRVTTSHASLVRNIVADPPIVQVKYDSKKQSQVHLLSVIVPPCDKEPIDCSLQVDLDIRRAAGERGVIRSFDLPIYRFYWNKESNNVTF